MELEDGYPTENELETIRNWEIKQWHGLLEYIREYFEQHGAWTKNGEIYILATCGWSGCEDIIGAMESNQMFWLLYWYSSTRSGRHIFCRCTIENLDRLDVVPIKG